MLYLILRAFLHSVIFEVITRTRVKTMTIRNTKPHNLEVQHQKFERTLVIVLKLYDVTCYMVVRFPNTFYYCIFQNSRIHCYDLLTIVMQPNVGKFC